MQQGYLSSLMLVLIRNVPADMHVGVVQGLQLTTLLISAGRR